jgi:hypothetical protein
MGEEGGRERKLSVEKTSKNRKWRRQLSPHKENNDKSSPSSEKDHLSTTFIKELLIQLSVTILTH